MHVQERTKPRLIAGLVLSLIVHCAAAIVMGALPRSDVRFGDPNATAEDLALHLDVPEPALLPEPPEQPKPDPDKPEPEPEPKPEKEVPPPPPPPPDHGIKLGNPDSPSEAVTMTWIGFNEYMENSGRESVVDQPQLTRDAPGIPAPAQALVQSRPTPAAEPTPSQAPNPPAAASPPADAPLEPQPIIADRFTQPESTGPASEPTSANLVKDEPANETPLAEQAKPRGQTPPPPPPPDQAPKPTPAPEVPAQPLEEIATTDSKTAPPKVTPTPASEGVADSKGEEHSATKPQAPRPDAKPADKPEGETAPPKPPQTLTQPDSKSADPIKPDSTISPEETVETAQSKPAPSEKDQPAADKRDPNAAVGPEPAGPLPRPENKPSTPAQAPSVSPSPPPSPAIAPGNNGAAPGIPSDRESIAAAIKKALKVEWGKPLVSKGLRVSPVRPRFTHYTTITSSPSSPVVRIHFNSEGKVSTVQLLRTSGNPDIDRPVIDACYEWRAEGEALKKISGKEPPETVWIDVRIIL